MIEQHRLWGRYVLPAAGARWVIKESRFCVFTDAVWRRTVVRTYDAPAGAYGFWMRAYPAHVVAE